VRAVVIGAPTSLVKGQNKTSFNVVRFREKPGREQGFLDAHNKVLAN